MSTQDFRLRLPSPPSSQKAVSCTLFVNSQGAGLFCVRGLRPLTRLWSRSSVEEKWFGSLWVITLRIGVSAPSTSSVSACCLVSARETPSRWSGVITADTTVSSSFLLRNGTATADTFVVRGSDHQSESKCATGPVGSAIVRQLKRGCTVLCRSSHCGLVSLPLTLPRCLPVALCLLVRLPLDVRESSRQTQPFLRRSSSETERQRQTPSSCGAVITNPNPNAPLVPSALLSFVS